MTEFSRDNLTVRIYNSSSEMGAAAAADIATKVRVLLGQADSLGMIFAAAPSQNEMLAALVTEPEVDWARVDAFAMDEYVAVGADSPYSFARYLDEHVFGKLPFRSTNCINATAADMKVECQRYADLITARKPSVVCMGIGENGHIAFNDPAVADFADPQKVKPVELDERCRQQQVNDAGFPSLEHVPTHGLTVTIPTLMAPAYRYCVVPGVRKRDAVEASIDGPVSEACPASILRTKPGTILYLDSESGARYLEGAQCV